MQQTSQRKRQTFQGKSVFFESSLSLFKSVAEFQLSISIDSFEVNDIRWKESRPIFFHHHLFSQKLRILF